MSQVTNFQIRLSRCLATVMFHGAPCSIDIRDQRYQRSDTKVLASDGVNL